MPTRTRGRAKLRAETYNAIHDELKAGTVRSEAQLMRAHKLTRHTVKRYLAAMGADDLFPPRPRTTQHEGQTCTDSQLRMALDELRMNPSLAARTPTDFEVRCALEALNPGCKYTDTYVARRLKILADRDKPLSAKPGRKRMLSDEQLEALYRRYALNRESSFGWMSVRNYLGEVLGRTDISMATAQRYHELLEGMYTTRNVR